MLEARCPHCGYLYLGWALKFPSNQYCEKCGAGLDVLDTDVSQIEDSPFETDELNVESEIEKLFRKYNS